MLDYGAIAALDVHFVYGLGTNFWYWNDEDRDLTKSYDTFTNRKKSFLLLTEF